MNNFKYRVLRIEPNITAVQKCAASVCMCSSHSFWTSSSLDVPAGVTQEESLRGAPLLDGEQEKWYQQILQEVQNFVPHDCIKSCTVYTVVQQYVLVDYCCFHLTSHQRSEKSLLRKSIRVLGNKRINALSTEPCFPIVGAVTCSRTSASRHTSFVSIIQALSFRSLGVPSPASSHTSRPKTFSFRGPCAGIQIPRAERQWN